MNVPPGNCYYFIALDNHGEDMPFIKLISTLFLISLFGCAPVPVDDPKTEPLGQLKVGFDIDDTVLFSRDNFLIAPHLSDDPDHLDYGWVNQHDSLHSITIDPIRDLIQMYRAQGHEVYFITARPGINGEYVARHLSRELGYEIKKDRDLFFAPKHKDPATGKKFTTKHLRITDLGLHIFFGDADNDMVAASVAGIRGVRVVRDQRSVVAYSRNYFGDTMSPGSDSAPFDSTQYQRFLEQGVGPYGETIYPIKWVPAD